MWTLLPRAVRRAGLALALTLALVPYAAVSGTSIVGTAHGTAPAQSVSSLDDALVDNRNGWPVGTHRYINEAGYNVVAESDEPGRSLAVDVPKVEQLRDLVVEAELTLHRASGTGWHGLLVRAGETGAYRVLLNGRGTFVVDRVSPTDWHDLVSPRSHAVILPSGKANVVRLAVVGDTISVSVNGQHVAHLRDDALSAAGRVQLVLSGAQHVTLRRISIRPGNPTDVEPPPAPPMLFDDMFWDNRNRWPQGADRPEEIRNYFDEAGYHVALPDSEPPGAWWFWPRPSTTGMPADIVAEADMTMVAGPIGRWFGISLRSTLDGETGYGALVTGNGLFGLFRAHPGGDATLVDWMPTAHLRPAGEPNVITLAAHGPALVVSINGQPVARVEDGAISGSGAVLLHAQGGVDVAVRRLSVWASSEADVPPVNEPPPLLLDEMRENRAGWGEIPEELYFADDGYHLDATKLGADRAWVSTPEKWFFAHHLAVRADIRVVESTPASAFGIGLRYRRDSRQGYRLLIDGDGYYALLRLEAEDPTELVEWQPHPAVRTGSGALNTLRLVARDHHIAAYINSEQVALLEDDRDVSAGEISLVVGSGAHVVARRVTVTEPADQDFTPTKPAPPAPLAPPSLAPAPPACLPTVEATRIESAAVRATVRNGCPGSSALVLSFILLESADGQPLASTGSQRWTAAPEDRRELTFPVDPKGAGAVAALATSWPVEGERTPICVAVGASRCLVVDPQLRGAVDVLLRVEPARPLLIASAESGVRIRRDRTRFGAFGAYQHSERTITLDTRLDAYSDWERAAVLSHELQHARDHAHGQPFSGRSNCFEREEDAFLAEAAIWRALWRDHLPAPQNGAQQLLNDIASTVERDPVTMVRSLTTFYEHQCG